jgi:hypothetical protein
MATLRELLEPDPTAPRRYVILLLAAGLGSALLAVPLFLTAFYYEGFGALCILALPIGFLVLMIDVLAYRAARQSYAVQQLSPQGARFMAREALATNGLPVSLAYLALLSGFLLGSENQQWLPGLDSLQLLGGAAFLVFVFLPFNFMGALAAFAILRVLGRHPRA